MGFMFCDLHVSLNNPSSGDINSLNLPCSNKNLHSIIFGQNRHIPSRIGASPASVVAGLLFYVPPIVCGGSVLLCITLCLF